MQEQPLPMKHMRIQVQRAWACGLVHMDVGLWAHGKIQAWVQAITTALWYFLLVTGNAALRCLLI